MKKNLSVADSAKVENISKGRVHSDLVSNLENSAKMENIDTIAENSVKGSEEKEVKDTFRAAVADSFKSAVSGSAIIADLEKQLSAAKLECLVASLHDSVVSEYSNYEGITDADVENLWTLAKETTNNFTLSFVSSHDEKISPVSTFKVSKGNATYFRYGILESDSKLSPVAIVAKWRAFIEMCSLFGSTQFNAYAPFEKIEKARKEKETAKKVVSSSSESAKVVMLAEMLSISLDEAREMLTKKLAK